MVRRDRSGPIQRPIASFDKMLHRLVRRCRATAASFFSALEVQYLAVAFDEHAEPCGGIGIIHKGDQFHRLCPLPLRAVSMALPDIRTKPSLSRSEERRVGKECVSTCSSQWSPYHSKKKQ